MNRKKFLVIGLLGLFMISMFAGIVSAGTLWDRFSSGDIMSDETKGGISKILLIVLVVLLVYSVAEALPFLGGDKEGVRWAFSIVVGILSFIFVSTEMVMTILTTYEALGIALTSFVPLIILMVFMWQLKEDHAAIAGFIKNPVYILFITYLVYKWIFTLEENPLQIIYLVAAITALIWMFVEDRAHKKLDKEKKKEERAQAANNVEDAVAGAGELGAAHKGLSQTTHGKQLEFDFKDKS
jgi:hypothetical protein